MNGWLVACSSHQREAWACENILRQGAQIYLPRFCERKLIGGKGNKKVVERAKLLFPGYIFVKTSGQWRFLLGTFGIIGIIMQGGAPAVLQDSIIDALKAREGKDGMLILPTKGKKLERFKRGSKVRIMEGTFSGYVGIYDGSAPHERERILLDFLGQRTTVLLGSDLLEEG